MFTDSEDTLKSAVTLFDKAREFTVCQYFQKPKKEITVKEIKEQQSKCTEKKEKPKKVKPEKPEKVKVKKIKKEKKSKKENRKKMVCEDDNEGDGLVFLCSSIS